MGEQVGRRMSPMIRSCGLGAVGFAWLGAEVLLSHQSCNPVFRAGVPEGAKFARHSWAAGGAGVAMVVNGFHCVKKDRVFLLAFACWALSGGVVATGRDIESVAEFKDGVFVPHDVNQRIPLCGSSESMLTAFFKISRWRRR